MHPLIETYGAQTIDELLDLVFIPEKVDNARWRHFLIKHGIIKQSTKTIRAYLTHSRHTEEWRYNPDTRRSEKVQLEEPYTRYVIRCRNGRNQFVFEVAFLDTELPQIREDIQNETNPNHE